MTVQWKHHIVSDPEILRGKPRIKGTRIPVGLVLGHLAAGKTSAEILAEFSVSCERSVRVAGKGLSQGKLTVPTGAGASIESANLKGEGSEQNAGTLRARGEERRKVDPSLRSG